MFDFGIGIGAKTISPEMRFLLVVVSAQKFWPFQDETKNLVSVIDYRQPSRV